MIGRLRGGRVASCGLARSITGTRGSAGGEGRAGGAARPPTPSLAGPRRVASSSKPMLIRRAALALLAAVLVLALPVGGVLARAHPSGPARSVPVTAGPYQVIVSFYDDPPRTGRALAFSVDPIAGVQLPGRLQVAARAEPGPGTNAVPVRASVGAHAEVPAGVAGTVTLPVAGAWVLVLDFQGPLGQARAQVPLQALPPPAIPRWLGWLIGLVPVFALVGVLAGESWRGWRRGGLGRLESPYGAAGSPLS